MAHNQGEQSELFPAYTPSGPFNVARPLPKVSHEDYVPAAAVANQTQFSCGSLGPKSMKKGLGLSEEFESGLEMKRREFGDKGGCMNCCIDRDAQPWEVSDGAVHLLAELARVDLAPRKAYELLVGVFALDHFRHHTNLKQSICERADEFARDPAFRGAILGEESSFPKTLRACEAQGEVRGLQVAAESAAAAWGLAA